MTEEINNETENKETLDPEVVRDPQKAIEAILFAAGYPVRYDKLAAVIGLPTKDIKKLVDDLSDQFVNRGIQLLMFPDTCQLATREEYGPYIREALGIKKGGNISASAMEVLAIIAYNQPVTKSYVESLRGADCSYAMSSLTDKELIEPSGRLDAPGRPFLYTTTDKFLRVFGLSSLDNLPQTDAVATLPDVQTALNLNPEQEEAAQKEATQEPEAAAEPTE